MRQFVRLVALGVVVLGFAACSSSDSGGGAGGTAGSTSTGGSAGVGGLTGTTDITEVQVDAKTGAIVSIEKEGAAKQRAEKQQDEREKK